MGSTLSWPFEHYVKLHMFYYTFLPTTPNYQGKLYVNFWVRWELHLAIVSGHSILKSECNLSAAKAVLALSRDILIF